MGHGRTTAVRPRDPRLCRPRPRSVRRIPVTMDSPLFTCTEYDLCHLLRCPKTGLRCCSSGPLLGSLETVRRRTPSHRHRPAGSGAILRLAQASAICPIHVSGPEAPARSLVGTMPTPACPTCGDTTTVGVSTIRGNR